jgi:hypothetical protein
MDDLLASLIKLPVAVIPDPLKPFDQYNGKLAGDNEATPEIAVATGLALSGLQDNVRD